MKDTIKIYLAVILTVALIVFVGVLMTNKNQEGVHISMPVSEYQKQIDRADDIEHVQDLLLNTLKEGLGLEE